MRTLRDLFDYCHIHHLIDQKSTLRGRLFPGKEGYEMDTLQAVKSRQISALEIAES